MFVYFSSQAMCCQRNTITEQVKLDSNQELAFKDCICWTCLVASFLYFWEKPSYLTHCRIKQHRVCICIMRRRIGGGQSPWPALLPGWGWWSRQGRDCQSWNHVGWLLRKTEMSNEKKLFERGLLYTVYYLYSGLYMIILHILRSMFHKSFLPMWVLYCHPNAGQ